LDGYLALTTIVPRAPVHPGHQPQRRLPKTASSTSARYRGSMAAARSNTCRVVSTGRSGDFSTDAPLILHGLRRIRPSSAAVFKTALSSRYAFATVTTLTSASSRSLRQRRTSGSRISATSRVPKVGDRVRTQQVTVQLDCLGPSARPLFDQGGACGAPGRKPDRSQLSQAHEQAAPAGHCRHPRLRLSSSRSARQGRLRRRLRDRLAPTLDPPPTRKGSSPRRTTAQSRTTSNLDCGANRESLCTLGDNGAGGCRRARGQDLSPPPSTTG